MSQPETSGVARHVPTASRFNLGAWIAANAMGLGITYALMALLGGVTESLGADHDSLTRDLAGLAGMLIGVSVFMTLRRRSVAGYVDSSIWPTVVAGIAMAAGFAVGFLVAGPPFDFVLGVVMLGTVGGALQWRQLKDSLPRPGRLLLASIAAWVAAGITALVAAIAIGDAIDAALGSGVSGFVAVTSVIGVAAGAVGGTIEGAALRRRIDRTE